MLTFRTLLEFQAYVAAMNGSGPMQQFLALVAADESFFLGTCYLVGLFLQWKLHEALAPAERGISVLLCGGFSNLDADIARVAAQAAPLGGTPKNLDPGAGGLAVPVGDPHRQILSVLGPHLRTLAHEIGHALFCPHAVAVRMQDSGMDADPLDHDGDDRHCVMNYDPADGEFCGMCHLRLRGWDMRALSNRAADNVG